MTLSSQLKDKNSPVSKWFRTHMDASLYRKFAQAVNYEATEYPVEIMPNHSEYGMAGTAFDYSFRWLIGPLHEEIVAAHAALFLFLTHKWTEAPKFVSKIIQIGNASQEIEKKATLSIILAWFDTYGRSGKITPALQFLLENQNSIDWESVNSLISKELAEDVTRLTYAALTTWGKDLDKAFILNPTFAGSRSVGGADADWITEEVLYDCKTTKIDRPFGRETLLQTLAYAFLDYDNQYNIHSLGWYYARRNLRIVYPLDEILPRLGFDLTLAGLRQSFANRDQTISIAPAINQKEGKRGKKSEHENTKIEVISLGAFDDWCKAHEGRFKYTSVERQPDNRRLITVYMDDNSMEKFLITF